MDEAVTEQIANVCMNHVNHKNGNTIIQNKGSLYKILNIFLINTNFVVNNIISYTFSYFCNIFLGYVTKFQKEVKYTYA